MQVVSAAESEGVGQGLEEAQHFRLRMVPMALTCSMYGGHLIADPTAEEEALAAALVTTIVDAQGRLIGAHLQLRALPPA